MSAEHHESKRRPGEGAASCNAEVAAQSYTAASPRQAHPIIISVLVHFGHTDEPHECFAPPRRHAIELGRVHRLAIYTDASDNPWVHIDYMSSTGERSRLIADAPGWPRLVAWELPDERREGGA